MISVYLSMSDMILVQSNYRASLLLYLIVDF
jgi:hypothetical protein